MHKAFLLIAALLLAAGAVYATDTNQGTPIPCVNEGQTMPIYPGYACCEGLTAIPTTSTDASGAITPLVGASICSHCGNGTCESWENYANCPSDCNTPLPCAKEGENFSLVYSNYPKNCCQGLTAWNSGMDTRKVVNGACVETGLVAGSPVGTCINCGDGVCGEKENLCNCPSDCTTSTPRTCGGIAGIACPEGYSCALDGNYPDAGGVCIPTQTCPQLMPPTPGYCSNGNISVAADERGCKRYVCDTSPTTGDFYRSAMWTCSNGKEFGETSDTCVPYASWREKARRTCAALSTDCAQTGTGASASDGNAEILAGFSDCIDGNVTVSDFRVSNQCRPECKETTTASGCTTVSCPNSASITTCPTSPTTCYTQSWDEIRALKEKCYSIGAQVVINFDNNCNKYVCLLGTAKTPIDANAACLVPGQIPPEKINACEENGGKFVAKTNDAGCLVIVQCVGGANAPNETKPINKKILSDSTQLLSFALTLESLRIDLKKTAAKVAAIADYYQSTGDTNAAARFTNAANLLNLAVTAIDEAKQTIKQNVDSFGEDDALAVRNKIQTIRETILKEALMNMLG